MLYSSFIVQNVVRMNLNESVVVFKLYTSLVGYDRYV